MTSLKTIMGIEVCFSTPSSAATSNPTVSAVYTICGTGGTQPWHLCLVLYLPSTYHRRVICNFALPSVSLCSSSCLLVCAFVFLYFVKMCVCVFYGIGGPGGGHQRPRRPRYVSLPAPARCGGPSSGGIPRP